MPRSTSATAIMRPAFFAASISRISASASSLRRRPSLALILARLSAFESFGINLDQTNGEEETGQIRLQDRPTAATSATVVEQGLENLGACWIADCRRSCGLLRLRKKPT